MTSRLINFELNFYRIRMVFTVGSKRGSKCFHFTPDLWVLPEKTLFLHLSYHRQSKMLLKALWREKPDLFFHPDLTLFRNINWIFTPASEHKRKVGGWWRVKALEGTLPNSRRGEKKGGNIKWCKKNKEKVPNVFMLMLYDWNHFMYSAVMDLETAAFNVASPTPLYSSVECVLKHKLGEKAD